MVQKIDTQKMTTRMIVAEMKRLAKEGKKPYLKTKGRKTYIVYS